jgi:hypothetical protein
MDSRKHQREKGKERQPTRVAGGCGQLSVREKQSGGLFLKSQGIAL